MLTPFVLALFPAALLDPLTRRLCQTRVPNALFALLILLLLLAGLVGAGAFVTVALIDQVPEIIDSVVTGLDQLERNLDWSVVPGEIDSLREMLAGGVEALTSNAALTQGFVAAEAVGSFFTGLVLMLVALFFFCKDGRRIWQAFLDFVPDDTRHGWMSSLRSPSGRSAQLLVALVDAVFIGAARPTAGGQRPRALHPGPARFASSAGHHLGGDDRGDPDGHPRRLSGRPCRCSHRTSDRQPTWPPAISPSSIDQVTRPAQA